MLKEEMLCYEFDASGIRGNAKDVMHPRSIEEAQDMIKRESRICIRGGGTGVVGGAVPEQNQDVVLCSSKLIRIQNIDVHRKTIEVEPGVILQDLQDYLEKFGLEFPVKVDTKDTATIGGMIATNALGSTYLTNKDTEHWVRWIEVIDSDGKIDRKGKTEISDYAGMEGITGFICKACLNLAPIKRVKSGSILRVDSGEKVIQTIHTLKSNEGIAGIDLIDPIISEGIGLKKAYHLLAEFYNDSGTFNEEADTYGEFIKKKKEVYPFLKHEGFLKTEDAKILSKHTEDFLLWLGDRSIPVYAHIASGFLFPSFYSGQEKYIPEFYKMVKKLGGKIRGRNGIGITKRAYVDISDKKILENIKKRTDPHNKFNTGKIL